ncbi:hypothetical protein BH09GEM1_BH09GEM1_27210 [soil metagenome]
MTAIPTEPLVASRGRPELIQAVAAGTIVEPNLDPRYEAAVRDTIERFEETGSPIISDGEQRKYHNPLDILGRGTGRYRARRIQVSLCREARSAHAAPHWWSIPLQAVRGQLSGHGAQVRTPAPQAGRNLSIGAEPHATSSPMATPRRTGSPNSVRCASMKPSNRTPRRERTKPTLTSSATSNGYVTHPEPRSASCGSHRLYSRPLTRAPLFASCPDRMLSRR